LLLKILFKHLQKLNFLIILIFFHYSNFPKISIIFPIKHYYPLNLHSYYLLKNHQKYLFYHFLYFYLTKEISSHFNLPSKYSDFNSLNLNFNYYPFLFYFIYLSCKKKKSLDWKKNDFYKKNPINIFNLTFSFFSL
jgi:hypothetical protein